MGWFDKSRDFAIPDFETEMKMSQTKAKLMKLKSWFQSRLWSERLYWLVFLGIPRSWITTIPNILGSIIPVNPQLIINQRGFSSHCSVGISHDGQVPRPR